MKDYDFDYGSKPISAWGYVGYSFLYAIPIIGWLVWLFKALFAKNRNVKNHARSCFCAFLVFVALAVVIAALYLFNCIDAGLVEQLGLPVDPLKLKAETAA